MNCGLGEGHSNNSVTRSMGCSIMPQYELQGRMWGFRGPKPGCKGIAGKRLGGRTLERIPPFQVIFS